MTKRVEEIIALRIKVYERKLVPKRIEVRTKKQRDTKEGLKKLRKNKYEKEHIKTDTQIKKQLCGSQSCFLTLFLCWFL